MSALEVGRRAGVDPDFVETIIQLGIVAPDGRGTFSSGDVRRVRLVRSLEQAGLPLDGMAAAIRQGTLSFDFMDRPVFDRFASLAEPTFRELSRQTGVPVELLMVVREALGFAQPSPEDHLREDELLIIPVIEKQVARGVRAAAIERWLRVYGESLRRMAETEADWWRSEIEIPLISSGVGEGEVLTLASQWGAEMAPLLDQATIALLHGHEEHAWMDNIIQNVENALEAVGLRSKLATPPAVCFLDITGYTRLTEERGDTAAADLASRLGQMVQRMSRERGGKPVKWLGDGVMFLFREPAGGVTAALEMVQGIADAGLGQAHVGLHAGPVVFQQGDYFGRTVNIAARMADYARPGEILVSQEVIAAAPDLRGIVFREIGDVELKGVTGPVRLHAAGREPPSVR
jgi:adenylate cyclase